MNPFLLIGLPYRLGADPRFHNAADCLSLTRMVLMHHGFKPPEPKREWYRRLRKGDTSVFDEQLSEYCEQIESPKIGAIALCESPLGLGLASYFSGGWLCFGESGVTWKPIEALPVKRLYCLMK